MAIIPLPDGIVAIDWTLPPRAAWASKSGYSGKATIIDRGTVTEGWRAAVKVTPRNALGVRDWRAWQAQMKGVVNTVRINASEDQASCPLASAAIWGTGRRANLLLQSTGFNSASWSKTNATVVTSFSSADSLPDGLPGIGPSWALTENSSNTNHYMTQTVTIGTVSPLTFSVYVRGLGQSWVQLTNGVCTAWFNLATGVIGSVFGGTASIEAVGNLYFRCSITSAPTVGTNSFSIAAATGDNNYTYLGTGAQALLVAAAQLELGPRASTYIATTTVAGLTGSDGFLINGLTPGTTYLRAGQLVTLRDRLFMLTEDIVGGIAGTANVGVQPNLPTLTNAGDFVLLRAPTCLMRLASAQLGWNVAPGPIYRPVDFSLEEVV